MPEGISRTEAYQIRDERMPAINKRNNLSDLPTEATFKDFVEGVWRQYTEIKQMKASTLYSYGSMLKTHILPSLGHLVFRRITSHDMTDFFSELQGRELAGKYRSNVYGLLNVMFGVAKEHDLIESIPLRKKIHRPSQTRRKKAAFQWLRLPP